MPQNANNALSSQNGALPVAKTPQRPGINRLQIGSTLSYPVVATSEFVCLIQAVNSMGQTLVYRALVGRMMEPANLSAPELPVRNLSGDVLHFLLSTRYCESDLLGPNAAELFGNLHQRHARVQAICDRVRTCTEYRVGSTNAATTARDALGHRMGVCRDFAHLAITFCRALNIPARLMSGYATFSDPPPNFRAVLENRPLRTLGAVGPCGHVAVGPDSALGQRAQRQRYGICHHLRRCAQGRDEPRCLVAKPQFDSQHVKARRAGSGLKKNLKIIALWTRLYCAKGLND